MSNTNYLLIDLPSRARLGTELFAQERPEEIDPKIWQMLIDGELPQVEFSIIGALVDAFGYGVLRLLDWPIRSKRGDIEAKNVPVSVSDG